jgi:hypothetical protein
VVGSLVELVRAERGLDHIRKLENAVRRHEDSGWGGGVATQMLERLGRSSQGEVEQAEDALAEDAGARAACIHELLDRVDVPSRLVFLSAQGLDRRLIRDVPARGPRLSDVERELASFLRSRVGEVEAAAADQLCGLAGR